METIEYQGKNLRKWTIGSSTFLACPQHGARLMNWNIAYADGTVRDIIYWPETRSMEHFAKIRGGNPILFPFCGKNFASGTPDHWKSPDGKQRPMPQHGFARQGRFETINENEHGFSARLVPDEEAEAAYPFKYEFTVLYRFEAAALYAELRLKNQDTVPIPWAGGHHFYFTVPWREGCRRSDYVLRIAAKEAFRQDPDGSLEPVPAPARETQLNSGELVDRIYTGLRNGEVSVAEKEEDGEALFLRVGDGQKKPPPSLAVVTWTEAEDSPFYCVEPWMGPPNAPAHGRGLSWVAPGKTESFLAEIAL